MENGESAKKITFDKQYIKSNIYRCENMMPTVKKIKKNYMNTAYKTCKFYMLLRCDRKKLKKKHETVFLLEVVHNNLKIMAQLII